MIKSRTIVGFVGIIGVAALASVHGQSGGGSGSALTAADRAGDPGAGDQVRSLAHGLRSR